MWSDTAAHPRRFRAKWRLCGAIAAAVLALAACTSKPADTGGSVKEGGVLRIGSDLGIDSLNPFVGIEQDAFNAWEQLYPQLVQYNLKTLDFAPDFATSWRQSSDGLTWTFKTQPNAKWSDGHPLTAQDVAWTYNTIIKFKSGSTAGMAGALAHIKDVEAQGTDTVVVHYDQPVGNALSNFQQVPILPEHVWASHATGNGSGITRYPNVPTNGKPLVSGGPFMCTEFVKKQVTLFSRNPNWYGPKPHIEGFGLQYYSNDDAMVEALKRGEIDAIEGVPVTSVNVLKSAGFHIFVGPSLFFRDLIINGNPQKTTHRELLNPLVREAFENAVDRGQIVKTAWLGYATPGTTDVPPVTGKWHDSSIKGLPFDLNRANQLLDQAGYAKGADGIRVADGHPMSYSLVFPTDQRGAGDRTFQILQADFRKIGVQISQRSLDPSAAFDAITANHYQTFDLGLWYWVPLMDPDFIMSAYTCAQYGDWNDSGYCNPAYDRLYAQQGVTIDPAKRLQIIYQMQKQVYDSRTEIVLVYNDTIDAWSTKWAGFIESPNGFWTQLSKPPLESVHQT